MTILAQLHDCHSCNDERSIVQKKRGLPHVGRGLASMVHAEISPMEPRTWLESLTLNRPCRSGGDIKDSVLPHIGENGSNVWLGLATCWRRTSERTLSVGSLHAFVFCFTRFHKVLGWLSCLALSNQQACVRPCCFTGRPRPLGTGFFNGSMVLSLDLLLPPLRFLTYGFLATGSPRLTASLSSSVTGKAPC